ncbi:hypothetical protein JTB14_037260 [Gonioctena quinquepunctata]|nr:hypothetical protein JTB14_037260 [Gonioctena quinquepunctata]
MLHNVSYPLESNNYLVMFFQGFKNALDWTNPGELCRKSDNCSPVIQCLFGNAWRNAKCRFWSDETSCTPLSLERVYRLIAFHAGLARNSYQRQFIESYHWGESILTVPY